MFRYIQTFCHSKFRLALFEYIYRHVSYVSPMLIVSVNINAPNSQHAGFGYIYLANDELNVGECDEERGRKGYDGGA